MLSLVVSLVDSINKTLMRTKPHTFLLSTDLYLPSPARPGSRLPAHEARTPDITRIAYYIAFD